MAFSAKPPPSLPESAMNGVAGMTAQSPVTTTAMPMSVDPHGAAVAPHAPNSAEDWRERQQHQDAIKSIQSAITFVPQSLHPELYASMVEKVEGHKAAIVALKPIGAQIEGARAALARAHARREKAIATKVEIMQKIDEADKDIVTLTEKVSALEASVVIAVTPMNSIEKLAKSLHQVIIEMSSGTVEPTIVKQTEVHMTQLLEGVKQIAAASKVAADANKNDATAKNQEAAAGVGGGGERRPRTEDLTDAGGPGAAKKPAVANPEGVPQGPAEKGLT